MRAQGGQSKHHVLGSLSLLEEGICTSQHNKAFMKGTCIFLSLANVYIPYKNTFETNVKISYRIEGLGFVLLVAGLIHFPMTVVTRSTATVIRGGGNSLCEHSKRNSMNPASRSE